MRVVVAYVTLDPAVPKALKRDHADAEFCYTGLSVTAYSELLCRVWRERQAFILLEQDKVPVPGALAALWACERPWCSYPVLMAGRGSAADFPSLSCVKFAASLMRDHPQAMERAAALDMGYGVGHWNRLDMAVTQELWRKTGPVHWHPPAMVKHQHEETHDPQELRR